MSDTAEQQARDLLERLNVEGAQAYSAGELVELANLIADASASQTAVRELCEAIRLTVEYTTTDVLPPREGWSWFDALSKHDPYTAQRFVEWHRQHAKCASCKHASHVGGECGAPIIEVAVPGLVSFGSDVVGMCHCGADVLPR